MSISLSNTKKIQPYLLMLCSFFLISCNNPMFFNRKERRDNRRYDFAVKGGPWRGSARSVLYRGI